MSEPKFRSDVLVRMAQAVGSDGTVARSAWVVGPNRGDDRDTPEGHRRVIRAMMRGRHGSTFEHGLLTVYAEAPAVVWWEWTRHRFMSLGAADHSFNLESGRYKVLDGVFYVPPPHRPIVEPDGFRPMRPRLEEAEAGEWHLMRAQLESAYTSAWEAYEATLSYGHAREVARLALPFGVYYAGYVSANPRSWLQFFSLRRMAEGAAVATHPQWEIASACEQCERLFEGVWPVVYDEFNRNGRVAP